MLYQVYNIDYDDGDFDNNVGACVVEMPENFEAMSANVQHELIEDAVADKVDKRPFDFEFEPYEEYDSE